LLEVLVAVAILAVALGAAVKVSSENAANAGYLRDRTYAHWVAANILTRYRVGIEPQQRGSRGGTSTMGEREWYWRTTISGEKVSAGGVDLGSVTRIEVEVRDRDDLERTPLARLVGYL